MMAPAVLLFALGHRYFSVGGIGAPSSASSSGRREVTSPAQPVRRRVNAGL
jgi:hypothetical protein